MSAAAVIASATKGGIVRTLSYAQRTAAVEAGSAKTILICEDDENLRQLIRAVLGAGYHVVEAVDGDEAVAMAHEHHPELIVLDLMLPRMSGLEVLAHLREEAPPGDAHILVMSAWPNSSDPARAAGADSFLPKPFNPDDLTKLVHAVLGEPKA
jgi:DNA-binding response OmpR family regulator